MNRKQLISKTAEALRLKNMRKPVKSPKQVFHISDDYGNEKDFTVRQTEKTVMYNTGDVAAILDTCLEVIEDSIRRGEAVHVQGFGTLNVHLRAARSTKHPRTKDAIEIKERYVPKFSYGNILRTAAKVYELSLDENKNEPLPEYEKFDGES